MRVLFLSQIVPYPPHGGVLQRGYNLVRELGRRAEVHLLAFNHPDVLPTEETVEESRRELSRWCARVEYFSLWAKASKVHRLAALAASAGSATPFSFVAHRSNALQRRIDQLLEEARFDVVHVDTIALSQFVTNGIGTAKVLTHHNIESMLMDRRAQMESGFAARTFLRREAAKLMGVERALAPTFDVNIVVSPSDRSALEALAPRATTAVVPNGVNTDYFTPDPDAETPALIYGGGMNMFANRDAVMHFVDDIWPLVQAQRPDVTFYAVGQDPPPQLKAAAERDPRIKVTGFVSDIRDYIRKAAVYVVPLRVGGGTRLKVLDAMAMGKAMVSTSIGCEGIDVRDGENLVIADDARAFADSTIALLGDRSRRMALGRAARSLVERQYSWPVIGDQLLDAYRLAEARTQSR